MRWFLLHVFGCLNMATFKTNGYHEPNQEAGLITSKTSHIYDI